MVCYTSFSDGELHIIFDIMLKVINEIAIWITAFLFAKLVRYSDGSVIEGKAGFGWLWQYSLNEAKRYSRRRVLGTMFQIKINSILKCDIMASQKVLRALEITILSRIVSNDITSKILLPEPA